MIKVTNPENHNAKINIEHRSGTLLLPIGGSDIFSDDQANFLKERYPWVTLEVIKEAVKAPEEDKKVEEVKGKSEPKLKEKDKAKTKPEVKAPEEDKKVEAPKA